MFFYLAESRIQRKLITDTVRGVGFSELLDRCKMDHVVSGLVSHTESILPLAERAQSLRQHRLTADTVHRDTVVHLTCVDYRIHQEIAGTIRLLHRITKNIPVVVFISSVILRPNSTI